MFFKNHFSKLQQADQLIRLKATGVPKEFAERLQISERALYLLIEEMKTLNFPIDYSEVRSSYYYTEEGKMVNEIFVRTGGEK